jgi:hypothetical protein
MTLLGLFKRGEIRGALLVMLILALVAAIVSLLVGWGMMPAPQSSPSGTELRLMGTQAAARGWPSSTPQDQPWPSPNDWSRNTLSGIWYYKISAPNSSNSGGNSFSMQLMQAGWPLPVIENKQMWWDWDDPALKGPVPDPAPSILYGRFFLNTAILGGGVWLIVFGPLGVWVIGRRMSWTLQGHCTFCGYDMVGVERCPECGWAKGERR